MKLLKFTPQTTGGHRSKESCIRFHKSGVITVSPEFVSQIKLKAGDSCFVAQDEEKPEDWFFIIGGGVDDSFKLREYKGNNGLCFNNSYIAKEIIDCFQLKTKSVSFKLATVPSESSDKETKKMKIYAILTSKPRYQETTEEETEEE